MKPKFGSLRKSIKSINSAHTDQTKKNTFDQIMNEKGNIMQVLQIFGV